MSRTRALWISAILTLAFVLVLGTVLLRPSASNSATARSQPATTTLDIGAGQPGQSEQLMAGEYWDDHHEDHDDHEDSDHHEHDEEHDDDD